MMQSYLKRYLGIFFIAAVIVPSIILSLMAVRAVNHEEAYIEMSLKKTFFEEADHTVILISSIMKEIEKELISTLETSLNNDIPSSFSNWEDHSDLVGIPFLLSVKKEILWPDIRNSLSKDEMAFLENNWEFFSDQKPIPVYENIVDAYKDTILVESEKLKQKKNLAAKKKELKSGYASNEVDKDMGLHQAQHSSQYANIEKQQVMNTFQTSKPVRKEVYKKAKGKGDVISYRTVMLNDSLDSVQQVDQTQELESILITEKLKFSEIIKNKATGIIPRFIEGELKHFFWKRDKSGKIVGCLINEEALKKKILNTLPNMITRLRILVILDENGDPLIFPKESHDQDWKRPFVSREIGEFLPRWEAAFYLSNPDLIRSRARFTSTVMYTLIFIMFISVLAGGFLVLKSLFEEIKLARQKTTFVANVSHELKTPITSIHMFAEMLKEKRQPDVDKQQKYLNIIVSETERLARLINNVLDFFRIGQKKKHVYNKRIINLVDLVSEIMENQRVRLEHNGFDFSYSTSADEILVNADEESIKQALLNLLSNAEKYSDQTKMIETEIISEQGLSFVKIKDRGIGIHPASAKKIFQEFYRTDDSLASRVRGTGLGLTIARRIALAHGGDILYSPHEGGGSVFQLTLPMHRSLQ